MTDPATKRPLRIKLPHGETDPRKLYSFPDPDELAEAYLEARFLLYPPMSWGTEERSRMRLQLTDKHIAALTMLAEGYLDLTTYDLGQEHCVKNLRDIWRARRARGDA